MIIAIGYSAGGQQALTDFFDATPTDGVSYVILRHLPVDYVSVLKNILRPHSKLEVIEAADHMAITSNKVYLMQADRYLTLKKGAFFSATRFLENQNVAVDQFFGSLARAGEFDAIGVILSGAGRDGSKGAQEIIQAGGLLIAQLPDTCEFPSMPQAAIAATQTPWVMSPSAMPLFIQQYVQQRSPGLKATQAVNEQE